jgi:toxin CcdB
MSQFNTRVVVPLLPLDVAPKPSGTPNPLFDICGIRYSMVTQYLASVLANSLQAPLFSVAHRRDDVTAALDLLIEGF